MKLEPFSPVRYLYPGTPGGDGFVLLAILLTVPSIAAVFFAGGGIFLLLPVGALLVPFGARTWKAAVRRRLLAAALLLAVIFTLLLSIRPSFYPSLIVTLLGALHAWHQSRKQPT